MMQPWTVYGVHASHGVPWSHEDLAILSSQNAVKLSLGCWKIPQGNIRVTSEGSSSPKTGPLQVLATQSLQLMAIWLTVHLLSLLRDSTGVEILPIQTLLQVAAFCMRCLLT